MRRRARFLPIVILIAAIAFLAAACGSHPKYYGECHVYVGKGTKYRATIDLYGSGDANSYEGRTRLAKACEAVKATE